MLPKRSVIIALLAILGIFFYFKSQGGTLKHDKQALSEQLMTTQRTVSESVEQIERLKTELNTKASDLEYVKRMKDEEIKRLNEKVRQLEREREASRQEKQDADLQQIQQQQQQQKRDDDKGLQDYVTLRKFEETKFGLKWLNVFMAEERDPLLAKFLSNAEKNPRRYVPTKGSPMASSWNCYELEGRDFVDVFDHLSAGSVCVFENLCADGQNFYLYGDQDTDLPFMDGQILEWPQTMNDQRPHTHYRRLSDLEGFFRGRSFEEEPAHLLTVSSPEPHITHWIETMGTLFMGRKYISEDLLPPSRKAYLSNAKGPIWDWQLKTMSIAMRRDTVPEVIYNDVLSRYNRDNPFCFKKVVVPGYQFYVFSSAEAGIAYKHEAYKFLSLPIPDSIPKVITISKRGGRRAITNIDEIEAHILKNYPEIEVRVIKFGDLTFEDQVRAMRDSGLLISIHGADVTNMLFLPKGAALIEVNPYRWYENRFFGISFVSGVEYFSYNCGNYECSGINGPTMVDVWPVSYYPPATDNLCRAELGVNGRRDTNVKVVIQDFDLVLREAFGYLGWGPKVRNSACK